VIEWERMIQSGSGQSLALIETKRASGVSLSTFKTLVWVSNLGGLFLFAIGMELMISGSFWFGISCIVIGVAIALFPSNYEIVGMEELGEGWEMGEEE
tara:strand:+ start:123 stop:416 length:294 start_codon:yes stop_codon:yes gene_type:complete